jgi:spore germination protein
MRTKILLAVLVLGMSLTAVAPVAAAPSEAQSAQWHRVVRGETLFSIGRLYNVYPYAIANVNSIQNPNHIYAGQWLYIPAGPSYYPSQSEPASCGSQYVVGYGDTLFRIGRTFGVTPWRIASANGIYNLDRIFAGQSLFIPCY